jgi:hypothetical protein
MRILIAPLTTGIGIEIHRSLKSVKNVELLGCGFDKVKALELEISKFIPLESHGSPEGLISSLNQIVTDYEIDFIFVSHDQWLRDLAIAKIPADLREKIVNLPTPSSSILLSKYKTYSSLKIENFNPRVELDWKRMQRFPIFVKPDEGQGSKGARLLRNTFELETFINSHSKSELDNYIYSEYLPGEEYTVDCFSNTSHEVVFCESRIRAQISNGLSSLTWRVSLNHIKEWADIISKQFSIIGSWFFQLKEDEEGQLKLLEVGLRVAGASGINRLLGVNLSLMQLYQFLGSEISVLDQSYPTFYSPTQNSSIMRFIPVNAYFDFDDTICLENRVNPRIKKAIHNLSSLGVNIHILTRNTSDLAHYLKFEGLFSAIRKVEVVPTNSSKSSYIEIGSNFIFVDDSHRERKDVYDKCRHFGLVLDPSAFETEIEFTENRNTL